MKQIRTTAFVIMTIFVISFVALLLTNNRQMSYSAFLKHDPKYFAQVAAACGDFLSRHPGSATTNVFIPDDNPGDDFLPPILRNLHSERMETSSDSFGKTNSVSRLVIMVGVRWGKLEKDGYEIIWENGREDSSLWNLTTYIEGLPDKIVFSSRETPDSVVGSPAK
jgi:hypothetical protein